MRCVWREEVLWVTVHKIRKRVSSSTTPMAEVDAPKVLWANDCQFDSAISGRRFLVCIDRRRTSSSDGAHRGREIHFR